MSRPTMFMIAGPNGAGKSTLYETRIKPRTNAPFINADVIQRDELMDASMHASYKAAEMAEARRRDYLEQGLSFVSESTFSHPSKLDLINDAIKIGFRVVMYHVNLSSPELSVYRVAYRFNHGGHGVPEDKIRERFARNPALIKQSVMQADKAFIYDNSSMGRPPILVIEFTKGKVVRASDRVPAWARELYANELAPFSPARLNPEAASFADAKLIARKLSGGDAVLYLPRKDSLAHIGSIVGESEKHWVQQLQNGIFVAHFKSKFDVDIKISKDYAITYEKNGQVCTVALSDLELQVGRKPPMVEVADLTQISAVAIDQSTQKNNSEKLLLTAAQWVAGVAAKPLAAAGLVDPKVRFRVLHVAVDGVVVDCGRSVAVYPVSDGGRVRVGDIVAVGGDGALALVPSISKGGVGVG